MTLPDVVVDSRPDDPQPAAHAARTKASMESTTRRLITIDESIGHLCRRVHSDDFAGPAIIASTFNRPASAPTPSAAPSPSNLRHVSLQLRFRALGRSASSWASCSSTGARSWARSRAFASRRRRRAWTGRRVRRGGVSAAERGWSAAAADAAVETGTATERLSRPWCPFDYWA